MSTPPTSELALRLIEENKGTKNPYLDLGNCGLTRLPPELGECPWLETLVLSNAWPEYDEGSWDEKQSQNGGEPNSIASIAGVEKLKRLTKLIVSRKYSEGPEQWPLKDLSPLSGLERLQKIDCARTMVSDLSPLAGLKSLRTLDCARTLVSTLSPLARLTELQWLDCSNTRVSGLSPLSKLTGLQLLDCGDTVVSDLSPLSGLARLQTLECYGTQVSDLSQMSWLMELNWFDCSNTQVADLSPLSGLGDLQMLNCHATQVTDLSPLTGLGKLQSLDCRETNVADLSPLSGLGNLLTLNCGYTQVSDLSPLSGLGDLQSLDCQETQVSDLWPLSGLGNLQTFYCYGTQVTHLSTLAKLPKLDYFDAGNCPIEDCPADVYQTGNGAELRAFFSRQQAEEQVAMEAAASGPDLAPDDRTNDVKLILLGNSDAGKTSLLHYLKTGGFLGTRDSTHGLEVHRWLPDAGRFPGLSGMAVSIWDFGGQEYYHGAYRLFMSANAAYLLLWDLGTNCNGRRPTCLKTDEGEVDLEHFELRYWLDTVRHYGGDNTRSPLFAVQNKTDLHGKQRLPQALHDSYGIGESFHLSLLQGCDRGSHPRDANALRQFDAELEHALLTMVDTTGLPATWLRIRASILELQEGKNKGKNQFEKRLEANGDGSLSQEKFEEACSKVIDGLLNVNEGKAIASALARGGVVVHFENSEALQGRVFLKPRELAERIYEVLKKQVLDLGGEFTLDQVFGENDEGDFRTVFIGATQSMGLVFPHPTKPGAFIAPQYLPEKHPIEDLYKIASHGTWQSSYWVRVPLFYYKKLLHGLVLHYASDPATDARYFWKHGIFFLKEDPLKGAPPKVRLRVLLKGLYPAEDQLEGILHVGVESSPTGGHVALQKEVFGQILRLLLTKDDGRRLPPGMEQRTKRGRKTDLSALELGGDRAGANLSMPVGETQDWLEVSTDGEYFTGYNYLKSKAAQDEIRVEAANKEDGRQQILIRHFEPLLDRPPKRAKRVFVSYSHTNTPWLHRLRAHLSGLRRSNDVETWDDQEILPGDLWDKSIKDKLAEADVFILLLSADFISSNYIWDVELKTAIEGYQTKGKLVIPVLVEPLDLGGLPGVNEEGTKIQIFEIVPKNKEERLQAISLWANQEEALAKVAERIRHAIRAKA